jgi:hypothetical protein
MNTKKALIAIIILLLTVNAVLGLYILSISRSSGEGITNEDVRTILKQREIALECRIPDYGLRPSEAVLGKNQFNEQSIEIIKGKFDGDVQIDDETGLLTYRNTQYDENASVDITRLWAENAADEFIESLGLNKADFILDSAVENAGSLYDFIYIYKDSSGNFYFDIYIEIEVGSGGVAKADIMYRGIEEVRSSGGDSVSIRTVLMANIIKRGDGGTVIQSISSGYKINDTEEMTAVMSWRVRFADGSERYFDAGNGMEIK